MPAARGIRVLIVDDEEMIADTMVEILRLHGMEAHAVYDGASALAVIDKFQPHAVITDVMMPRLSGIDLALWLAESHPHCKVLLISANVTAIQSIQHTVQGLARESFAYMFLPKPVPPEQILEFLATCAS